MLRHHALLCCYVLHIVSPIVRSNWARLVLSWKLILDSHELGKVVLQAFHLSVIPRIDRSPVALSHPTGFWFWVSGISAPPGRRGARVVQ
jgi:hypothetical protein